MGSDVDQLRRYEPLVGDWESFVAACREPLPVVIWANPLRRATLAAFNRADGIEPATDAGWNSEAAMLAARMRHRGYGCEPLGWYPGGMKVTGLDKPGLTLEYVLGTYHVQEEVSLLPAQVMAPNPGERILDLCAAPGGKTAQLAVAADGQATVVGNDVRIERIRALRSNSERLGLSNVAITVQNGTRFPLEAGPFDAVLLDVPCSCEGNVRQGSGFGYPNARGSTSNRAGLQATLLGRAWKLLAPGGRMLYATCTFAPEENEMVLDYSLRDDARIVPLDVPGFDLDPGVTEWEGQSLRPDCAHVARAWPHRNNTGGFTLALLEKDAAA